MAKIKIQFTGEFVESELKTGNKIEDKLEITKGIPADAKLIYAGIVFNPKLVLELTFHTQEPDYIDGEIIRPVLRKIFRGGSDDNIKKGQ